MLLGSETRRARAKDASAVHKEQRNKEKAFARPSQRAPAKARAAGPGPNSLWVPSVVEGVVNRSLRPSVHNHRQWELLGAVVIVARIEARRVDEPGVAGVAVAALAAELADDAHPQRGEAAVVGVGQPVNNNIAAVLRRMQPRRQRYCGILLGQPGAVRRVAAEDFRGAGERGLREEKRLSLRACDADAARRMLGDEHLRRLAPVRSRIC